MAWFQLDPHSLARRARESDHAAPSLAQSLTRGIVGFSLVSIAGFAPWAVGGTWLFNNLGGEFAVYATCALVFLILTGAMLHPLIIGPGSFARFNKLFGIAFGAYAATWIFCWMMIAGETGCIIGLLVGTILMSWILTRAFDATSIMLPVVIALSLMSLLGFYGGTWVEGQITRRQDITLQMVSLGISRPVVIAQLTWGAVYGACFGAGLGLAFYLCQAQARELLREGG